MNAHIKNYINNYIDLKNPQYAIMIKGEWGCGKTYFIKQIIKELENEKKITTIYISLYGLEHTNQINNKIFEKLYPIKSTLFKNIKDIKFSIKGAVEIQSIFLSLLKYGNISTSKNVLLIFDDLERCNISTENIFGYINEFVEHLSCKIIILANEDKIENSKQDEKYIDLKEKLIGKTFHIQMDVENILNEFINLEDLNIIKKDLLLYKDIIQQIFITNACNNLRILKRSLLDLVGFIEIIDIDIKNSEDKYDKFIKNLIAHFLIVYLEYSTGNREIVNVSSPLLYSITKKDNSENKKFKYNDILQKYNLLSPYSFIDYRYIMNFIENGSVNTHDLNKAIKKTSIFNIKESSLEALRWWQYMEYNDFEKECRNLYLILLENKNDIYTQISECNLLCFFQEQKFIKLDKSNDDIIEILMNNINTYINGIDFLIPEHSFDRVHEELKDKILPIIIKHNEFIIHNKIINIFENLTNEKVHQIFSIQDELNKNYTFYDRSLFKGINGEECANAIVQLSNENIIEVSQYFSIYHRNNKYRKGDDLFLIDLRKNINKNKDKADKIKRYNLQDFIKIIDEIIKTNNIKNENIEIKY